MCKYTCKLSRCTGSDLIQNAIDNPEKPRCDHKCYIRQHVCHLCVSVWVCVCIVWWRFAHLCVVIARLHVWSRILRTTPKHRKCEQGRASRRCEGCARFVRTFVETLSIRESSVCSKMLRLKLKLRFLVHHTSRR